MALLALDTAHHNYFASREYLQLACRQQQMVAEAGPPASDARTDLELQLKMIDVEFDQLQTKVQVLEARRTGEFPAIVAGSSYDVGGLEAEPGFRLSFDAAAALGLRLQELISSESFDGDLDY